MKLQETVHSFVEKTIIAEVVSLYGYNLQLTPVFLLPKVLTLLSMDLAYQKDYLNGGYLHLYVEGLDEAADVFPPLKIKYNKHFLIKKIEEESAFSRFDLFFLT